MSDSSSKRPHAGVGGAYYPFSMPDETRESISAPTEREGGPVMRRIIRAASVSRPAKTRKNTELYSRGELTDTELDRVMTVAVPAFAIGCLVGMLL